MGHTPVSVRLIDIHGSASSLGNYTAPATQCCTLNMTCSVCANALWVTVCITARDCNRTLKYFTVLLMSKRIETFAYRKSLAMQEDKLTLHLQK